MHDEDFLHAIAEAPGDDAPRLVYADWLDDHAQPDRAELIRAQCRVNALAGEAAWMRDEAELCERLPAAYRADSLWMERLSFAAGGPPCPEELALRRRAAELVAAHGREWLGGLPLPGWFHRGMPAGACASFPELLEHAAAIRAMPTLRALSLDFNRGQPSTSSAARLRDYQWEERLRPTGVFDRCEELLVAGLPGDSRESLIDLSLMPRLRRLVAHGNEVPFLPPHTSQIQGPLAWYEITGWRLGTNTESGWADEIFAECVLRGLRGPTLRYLDFSENDVSDAGVIALAGSANMARLRTLRLNWSWLTGAGLEALGRSPHLAGLRHLDLASVQDWRQDDSTYMTDDTLRALLATPLPGRLHLLDVSNAALRPEAVAGMVQTSAVSGLRVFVVGPSWREAEAWRSGRAVRAIAESPHLRGLRRLALNSVPLDDGLALALARSRALEGLHTLELWTCPRPGGLAEASVRELEGRYRVLWNGAPAEAALG